LEDSAESFTDMAPTLTKHVASYRDSPKGN